jgi:hypothetical protein
MSLKSNMRPMYSKGLPLTEMKSNHLDKNVERVGEEKHALVL